MTTRDELVNLLLANDAGFGLYKREHWTRVVRDEIEPWLAEHDRETRDEALVEAAAKFEGPDRFIRAVDVRRRLREGATR